MLWLIFTKIEETTDNTCEDAPYSSSVVHAYSSTQKAYRYWYDVPYLPFPRFLDVLFSSLDPSQYQISDLEDSLLHPSVIVPRHPLLVVRVPIIAMFVQQVLRDPQCFPSAFRSCEASTTSTVITSSAPYISEKGVSPVGIHGAVRYAHSTVGSSSTHDRPDPWSRAFSAAMMLRLVTSIWPLDSEWSTEVV